MAAGPSRGGHTGEELAAHQDRVLPSLYVCAIGQGAEGLAFHADYGAI